MSPSSEMIWHYSCPHCKLWWSVATSASYGPFNTFNVSHRDAPKCKYCCHCGKPYDHDDDTDFSTGFTGVM
jgi:hypothetical protein